MKFDKLNKLIGPDYFEPMAISVDDKNRRRELCDLLTDVFLYFFSVYEVHQMHNSMLEKALYEQLLVDKVSDAVAEVTGIDSFMSSHIRTLAKEVVATTFEHANGNGDKENDQIGQTSQKPPHDYSVFDSQTAYPDSAESLTFNADVGDSHIEDQDQERDEPINEDDDEVEELMEKEAVMDYWLSIHRAINIAQNEANTFLNYSDFVDAKESGKMQKTWLTMLDSKVRDTHDEVEGQTVGIDEFFQVGDSELRFPHDWMMAPDPKETINCRCAVEYS